MSVGELLTSLEAAGVVLSVEDGALRYKARIGALTDELRAAVRQHRAEIIANLCSAAGWKNTHPVLLETVQTCKPDVGNGALTRDGDPQETFASSFAGSVQSSPECKGPGPRTAAELVAALPQAPCHGGCGRQTPFGWECPSCRTAAGGDAL
jgi:hypothetical protein